MLRPWYRSSERPTGAPGGRDTPGIGGEARDGDAGRRETALTTSVSQPKSAGEANVDTVGDEAILAAQRALRAAGRGGPPSP